MNVPPPKLTLMLHVTGLGGAIGLRERRWLRALSSLEGSPVQRILLEFLDLWACPMPQHDFFLRAFYEQACKFPLPPTVQVRRFRQNRPDGPLQVGDPGTRLYDATEWLEVYAHLRFLCESLKHYGPRGVNIEAHGDARDVVDLKHCDRGRLLETISLVRIAALRADTLPDIVRPGDGRFEDAFGWILGVAGHAATTETLRARTDVPAEEWRQAPPWVHIVGRDHVRYMVSYVEGPTDPLGCGITFKGFRGMDWETITDRLSIPATMGQPKQMLPESVILATNGPGTLDLIRGLAEWRV